MNHEDFEFLDGAYLLNALEPGERARYEAHLAGCARCRASLDEIRDLVPLLILGDEESLTDDQAGALPDAVVANLQAFARRSLRRRRARLAAAGGLAAAVIAGVLTFAGLQSSEPAQARPMTALRPSAVSATVALTSTSGGTRIQVTCHYPASAAADGYQYSLSVRDAAGGVHPLGSWSLAPGGEVGFTAVTPLTPDQIRNVDIADSDGTALLESAYS